MSKTTEYYIAMMLARILREKISNGPVSISPTIRPILTPDDFKGDEIWTSFKQTQERIAKICEERHRERLKSLLIAEKGQFSEIEVPPLNKPSGRASHYRRIDLKLRASSTFALGIPVFF